MCRFFFFQAEDGIRDLYVTGVQTCALPIWRAEAAGLAGPAIFMIGVRAAIEFELGDAAQAEALARHALELTRRGGLDEHPFAATAHIVTGRAHARQGALDEAVAQSDRSRCAPTP